MADSVYTRKTIDWRQYYILSSTVLQKDVVTDFPEHRERVHRFTLFITVLEGFPGGTVSGPMSNEKGIYPTDPRFWSSVHKNTGLKHLEGKYGGPIGM